MRPADPLTLPARRVVGVLALAVALALLAVESGAVAGSAGGRGEATAAGVAGTAPAGPRSGAATGEAETGEAATGGAAAGESTAGEPAAGGAPAGDADPRAAEDAGAGGPADPAAPTPAAARTPTPPVRAHVVAPGDTVGTIAERHGVGSRELARANRHVGADALQPGMRLAVPDPAAPRYATPEEAMAAGADLERLLDEVARAYGWNPATVKAVAWVESRWDQHVISHRGAIGVMQVLPATGELMAEEVGRPLDLHDLRDNVEAGVAYLDHLHGRYGSDTRALLAAYHQGPGALRDHGIYRVSDRYADRILALREVFRAGR
jgi:soluble lytic murein transglycosylase-like protein